VGIKYFPVEQEKTTAVDKPKKIQWTMARTLMLLC
jgi:hypothetical protein